MSDFPAGWELLLDRYLAGECTPAESMEVNRMLAASPELRESVEMLRASRHRARSHPAELPHAALPRETIRTAWSEVAPRLIDGGTSAPVPLRIRFHGKPRSAGSWVIAATLILAVGIAARYSGLSRIAPFLHAREYTSRAGQRLDITLSDGTRLTLGPASHLKLAADYGVAGRRVTVEGEAYFSVVHDAQQPFAVHVRNATVKDVGTVFAVRAYPDDAAPQIAVTQGQVCVRISETPRPSDRSCGVMDGASLSAGDLAVVTATDVVVARDADVGAATAWVQGQLVFKNTPLRDVVRDLERAFDLEITVADSGLLNKPITAALADQSADFVLENVTAVIGAQFERHGRHVAIRRRAAGAERTTTPPVAPQLTTAAVRDR